MKPLKSFFRIVRILLIVAVIVTLYSCEEIKRDNSSSIKDQTLNEKLLLSANELSVDTINIYAKGKEIYKQTCQACHQENGEGLPNTFPPLAKSDYLLADKVRAIKQILKGSSGEIIVNGQKFNSAMPPQNLSDEHVTDVLNYVMNSWGNNGGVITIDEVKAQRGS